MLTPNLLPPSWTPFLSDCFTQPYMLKLGQFLSSEYQQQKPILPEFNDVFSAFKLTSFEQVKVVILGQDPYHGIGQAHGLAFSVLPNVALPPSLKNIYKELMQDLGVQAPKNGCLSAWAEQGVLLLNSVLTVESGKAASHQKKGWEQFTDEVISQLNNHHQGLVFILWGAYAQKKGAMIDAQKHLVLKSAHPSPLSVRHGFFGSRPFSQANAYLRKQGKSEITWAV